MANGASFAVIATALSPPEIIPKGSAMRAVPHAEI